MPPSLPEPAVVEVPQPGVEAPDPEPAIEPPEAPVAHVEDDAVPPAVQEDQD